MSQYKGCRFCRHLDRNYFLTGRPSCSAFPDGIPMMILDGQIEHTQPFPEQNNQIAYEPIQEK